MACPRHLDLHRSPSAHPTAALDHGPLLDAHLALPALQEQLILTPRPSRHLLVQFAVLVLLLTFLASPNALNAL